jgi:hypothetical protein
MSKLYNPKPYKNPKIPETPNPKETLKNPENLKGRTTTKVSGSGGSVSSALSNTCRR